jgi:hypothetical protein
MSKVRLLSAVAAAGMALGSLGCGRSAEARASGKRVIVLGIDGMDPNFVERHWDVLPNLAKLRSEGEFKRLETTMPPQSPVAWSTFITGMDPGGHGIFDFIHRDPKTLAPYSSMAQTSEGGRTISAGPYELPMTSGQVVSFRKGKPFWQILADRKIPVSVIRMPTDFPPVHCDDGVSISGMGTPDLRGTFGEFAFYTDVDSQKDRKVPGGRIMRVALKNHSATLQIPGPDNSLRKDKAPPMSQYRFTWTPKRRGVFDIGDTQ